MRDTQARINAQIDGIRSVATAFTGSWLRHSNAPDRLPQVFSKLAVVCDKAITDFERQRIETGDQHTLACKSGCDHCCRHETVVATPLEVFALAAWIRENRTVLEIHRIKERAEAYLEHFRTNDPSCLPCPVLENGGCQGYGGRPLICRGYHSFSLDSCRRKYRGLDDTIPHNRPAYLAAGHMRGSISAKISEHNLPAPQVVLGAALAIALRDEQGLERWLSGENLFEGLEFKLPYGAHRSEIEYIKTH
ncbi:MAG: hypothetical protein JSS72_06900 [Armatimonadetes bacterium]|nr:hypothetical protein [Armatimonadota bacterium]